MIHVVLYEPEIAPNTGNIIRLCANTGAQLHLIRPLGFALDDAKLLRAGLDYHEWAKVREHDSLTSCLRTLKSTAAWAVTTRADTIYSEIAYPAEVALVFGPETRGLPQTLLDNWQDRRLARLPMRTTGRSLNMANTVAVMVYEVWRQHHFHRLSDP